MWVRGWRRPPGRFVSGGVPRQATASRTHCAIPVGDKVHPRGRFSQMREGEIFFRRQTMLGDVRSRHEALKSFHREHSDEVRETFRFGAGEVGGYVRENDNPVRPDRERRRVGVSLWLRRR